MANWTNIFDSDFESNVGLNTAAWTPIDTFGGGWFTSGLPTDYLYSTDATVVSSGGEFFAEYDTSATSATLHPKMFASATGSGAVGEFVVYPHVTMAPNVAVRISSVMDATLPPEAPDGVVSATMSCRIGFGTPSEGFGLGPGFQALGFRLDASTALYYDSLSNGWRRSLEISINDSAETLASLVLPAAPSSAPTSFWLEYGDGIARVFVDGTLTTMAAVDIPEGMLPADIYSFISLQRRDGNFDPIPTDPVRLTYFAIDTAPVGEGDAGVTFFPPVELPLQARLFSGAEAPPVPEGDVTSSVSIGDFLAAGAAVRAEVLSDLAITDSLTGRATLNALLFSAMGVAASSGDLGTGVTWVVNAETGATSTYEGFDFNSLVKWGDTYLGAKADGIYELEGADDEGQPIRAQISFGMSTFGTLSKKMVEHAYLGVASDGHLYVRITADGQTYTYKTDRSAQDFYTQRARLGKGLRATHITLEVLNEVGSDFELSDVQFLINFLSRRI